ACRRPYLAYDRIGVSLASSDVEVCRASAKLAQLLCLFLAAFEAVLARHCKDHDPRASGTTSEIDEFPDQFGRLRSSTNNEKRPLRLCQARKHRSRSKSKRGKRAAIPSHWPGRFEKMHA